VTNWNTDEWEFVEVSHKVVCGLFSHGKLPENCSGIIS